MSTFGSILSLDSLGLSIKGRQFLMYIEKQRQNIRQNNNTQHQTFEQLQIT